MCPACIPPQAGHTHIRAPPAVVAPLLYVLDTGLLLAMLRRGSSDPQLRAELATPDAINRLAGTYTQWRQARTTYPPAPWSPR